MVAASDQISLPRPHAGHGLRLRLGAGLLVVGALSVALLMTLANPSGAAVGERAFRIAKAASGGFSDDALKAANAEMDPAMLALARRYDPVTARPAKGLTLTPDNQGPLGANPFEISPQKAAEINADLPFSAEPNPPARPFSLAGASELDRSRAIGCMTQVIYYEAAFEPLDGQRAVAQVVINRMRHPAFPKTICGVAFQGANLPTGCQFSFTCDGSLARPPVAWAWQRAAQVAAEALNGFVMKSVGGATHYHADYVSPYWAPRLFKVQKIGAHIFYRWPGSWGLPAAFNGRYAGLERPGVDLGGNPLNVDLATLRLAGLEGAAQAVQTAARDGATFTLAALTPSEHAAPTIAAPVIPEAPGPDASRLPPPLPVVEINRQPPRQRPRLAMPD